MLSAVQRLRLLLGVIVVSQLQMLYYQDTKYTKFHQEKQDVNFVFLGVPGVLVVRSLSFFTMTNY
jgi:hypothetical protein